VIDPSIGRPNVGLVYRSARVYRLAMRILERGEGARRLKIIAEAIEPGSAVVDLCCGDARLAPLVLAKGCTYRGLDINPAFVRWGKRQHINVRHWDANTMEIPPADVICMLSSLYQFIPDDGALVAEMVQKAQKLVIVSEPIQNWASSDSAALRWASRLLSHIDGRVFEDRHRESTLHALAGTLPAEATVVRIGRELILFLVPRDHSPDGDALVEPVDTPVE
jgi:Methionine biosynthesis protein MetW